MVGRHRDVRHLIHGRSLPAVRRTGAISDWTLSLPEIFRCSIIGRLSNVGDHIRYTARDGGAMLTSAATGALRKAFQRNQARGGKDGFYRLISLRHDGRTIGTGFRGATAPTTLQVEREVLPHQFRDIAKRAETGSAMLSRQARQPKAKCGKCDFSRTRQRCQRGLDWLTIPPPDRRRD
ncbi:hypothetical protein F2981_32695 (plasmid) [Sinorhizobium meliloti]|nr:hypothetical protein [Sinorhizobium meliloti]